jgi:hypothetical protein
MGYYIAGPTHGKGSMLEKEHGALPASQEEVRKVVDTMGVIVVVNNGHFEAAAFAYDLGEFEAFMDPDDARPKQCYVMNRADAIRASGYVERTRA